MFTWSLITGGIRGLRLVKGVVVFWFYSAGAHDWSRARTATVSLWEGNVSFLAEQYWCFNQIVVQ